jgi:hypothetical protein
VINMAVNGRLADNAMARPATSPAGSGMRDNNMKTDIRELPAA